MQADRLVELSRRWAAPWPRTPRLADLHSVIPAPAAAIETRAAPPHLTLPSMPLSPPLRVTAGVVTLHPDHQRVQSVRLGIGGACVTRQQVNQRFGRPDRVRPPSGHAPEQVLTLSYAEADRWISYLFPGVDHRCVSQVVLTIAVPRSLDFRKEGFMFRSHSGHAPRTHAGDHPQCNGPPCRPDT
ncbi:hypothetical protein [Stenotrophomonas sp. 57]|uniref:hypothetical protein n=1 Tax=Stenotrophomonas sp. 57 TaxID=3051119 RepID=UPI00256F3FCA|nr:hypothetical protein [Stenotrophomonas sp. 57]